MAGAQVGVDIIIRARDAVKDGANSAARSLQSSLRGAGNSLAEGVMGRMSRLTFKGVVDAAVGSVDDGLASLTQSLQEWRDGDGSMTAADVGAKFGVSMMESLTGALKDFPIAGQLGQLFAEAIDSITGGSMSLERVHEAAVRAGEGLQEAGSGAAKARQDFEGLLLTLRGMAQEEDKYQKQLRAGEALIAERYQLEVKMARGNLEEIMRLNRARDADHERLRQAVDEARRRDQNDAASKKLEEANRKREAEEERRREREEQESERRRLAEEQKRQRAEEDAARERERAQDAERQRVESLVSAEERLAGARESKATRAIQFRAGATGRAASQAAGGMMGSLEPLLKPLQDSNGQQRHMAALLESIERKLPEFVRGSP